MTTQELENRLDEAFNIIEERIAMQQQIYDEKGITYSRISFEDISLDDILESHLLPLLQDLINQYPLLPIQDRYKCYRVYIGSLCEIVKNGLVNRGILKTMDARIGIFDRNRHYSLLKDALRFEGIEVIDKPRHFEETIINEAGIPRGYHSKCIEFFKIYWKWLHNYDAAERESYLRGFLNKTPTDRIYIIDGNDYRRMIILREEISSFSEKVIKTCLKLDMVFTAIDSYPEVITYENVEAVAADISSKIGFDIFSVVRSDAVRQYILEYAKQVSFTKFVRIKQGLPDGETILLPTGKKLRNCDYKFNRILGGRHYIRGNAYEVSFPNSFSVEDYFSLDLQKPLIYGNSVIYVSDEPICAEIDGYEKTARTFINRNKETRYVFYERISPASFVYLDGIPLQQIEPFSKKTYICKYWDAEIGHYRLALCIDMLKYANTSDSMRSVSFRCNGTEMIRGQTNRYGSYRISDRLFTLDEMILSPSIVQEFFVNEKRISKWTNEVSDLYLLAKQTGTRIYDEINLAKWFGPPIILLFSKEMIRDTSFPVQHLYDEQGYHVYEGIFDRSADRVIIQGQSIPIRRPTQSFIELQTPYSVYTEKMCVNDQDRLSLRIHNFDYNDTSQILLIEHDNERHSYNLLQLSERDLENVCSLLPGSGEGTTNHIGQWTFILYKNNRRVDELSVEILPKINIISQKAYYSEGEEVEIELLSSAKCFEQEGEYVNRKQLSIGKAAIGMKGNYVYTIPLQFDCLIDKCDVIQQMEFSPPLWGIKMMDMRTKTWLQNTLSSISYEELKFYGIFICSTIDTDLKITSGDYKARRLVHSGYNKIDVKQLLWDFGSQTKVVIRDNYESVQTFQILCPPCISASRFEVLESSVVATINYFGPSNTSLVIRVYSGNILIYSIRKQVFRNRFSTSVYIDKKRLCDSTIIIEARIGNQDYQQIANQKIDLDHPVKEVTMVETERFSKSMSILSFLAYTVPERRFALPNELLAFLETEGVK